MDTTDTGHASFEIKDCALAAIATGIRAQNLKELRNIVRDIDSGCIYYHFWSGLLKARFDDPEYYNDFASWARHALHDKVLAERLGTIDPARLPDLEELRLAIVDILEARMDEIETISWTRPDAEFHFITSQIVVFDTRKVIHEPEELAVVVPSMSRSSIFYHFIDARRRTFGNIDDFSSWLYGFEDRYRDLCGLLGNVDPYFGTLTELRQQLAGIFAGRFGERSR
ncbi:MAG: hypothetical protein JW876_03760 [Candidatus Krumholzibacteriota bacterium]|uniref:Uncharacterized protein n=1 Tax=Eiseniibacteriota bacterium TaxID=2212470 RepID=A0A7V2F2M2_UNCEI|nr:hypothetical protein [Candidatus Krumholzibacteriota bacterium]HER42947.1 hypothetical protein [Candidatus Eisenbacteria bacterium]